MARIRSVHPGLFTDEAFASVSMPARVLFIGIWTECDDFGAFEWKPIGLKMRLMPVDNVDVAALLAELVAANMVRQYANDGRQYGLVRNFCRYQRPKKPKAAHFIPIEFRTYVGSEPTSGEPEPVEADPVPPKSEISPQMEDGGWRMEEEQTKPTDAETVARAPKRAIKAHFEVGVIRLTKPDFDRWEAHFPNLSLRAELESLADWAAKQADWFHAVAGALAKRNRQAGERMALERTRPTAASVKVAL